MVNPSSGAWGLWAASVFLFGAGRWYISTRTQCFTQARPCAQRVERLAFVSTQFAALCTAAFLAVHSFPLFWALVPVTVILPLLFNVLQAPLSNSHDCWSRTSGVCAKFVEAADDSDMDSDSDDDDGENAVVVPAHASVAAKSFGIGDNGGGGAATVAEGGGTSRAAAASLGFAATPPNSVRSTSRSLVGNGSDGRGRADSAHWVEPGSQRTRAATLISKLSAEKEVLEAQLTERERTMSRVNELRQQKAELEAKLEELEAGGSGSEVGDVDGASAGAAALTVTKESASV